MAGAILGPLIGAIAPFILQKLFSGSGPQKTGQVQNYDFENNPLFNQAQQTLQNSPYMKQWDPAQANKNFDVGVADPANKYYQERIQPQTRNQYFSPSGVNTSAMRKALDQGATDLGSSLAGLRSNYLQQGEQSHANNQYNAIAQALGLSSAQAGQNHSFHDEGSGGLGDILGPILQNLGGTKGDFGDLFGKIPGFSESGFGKWWGGSPAASQPQPQSSWQVPGQLSYDKLIGGNY
ncbi:MAG: hypothetical protein V4509_01900 [Patescibacteria group bacterium]